MGSTQLTHDLFRTLLDPGDTVMLLDPDLRELRRAARLRRARREDRAAARARSADVVVPAGDAIRPASRANSRGCSISIARGWCCSARPTIRRARSLPQALADAMLAKTVRGRRVAGDRLRLQVPVLPDAARVLRVVARRSSERHRHPLELEVGARARPAARLDRSARRPSSKRSSACSSAASSAPTRCRR